MRVQKVGIDDIMTFLFVNLVLLMLPTRAQSSANYIKHSGRCKDENLRNITNTTEDDCRTRCDADANCKAFEFVPPGAPSPYDALSQCMLKHTIPHFCQCTKWVNCSVKIAPPNSYSDGIMDAEGFIRLAYDFGGYNIRWSNKSPEECAEWCRNDENCNGFVFNYRPTSSSNCFLKRLIVGAGHCLTAMHTYVKIDSNNGALQPRDICQNARVTTGSINCSHIDTTCIDGQSTGLSPNCSSLAYTCATPQNPVSANSIMTGTITSGYYILKGPMDHSLQGYVFMSLKVPLTQCPLFCIQESAKCRSFNYNKHTGVCELNSKGITNMSELSPNPDFLYYEKE